MRWDPRLTPSRAEPISQVRPADPAPRCGDARTGLPVTGYLEGLMHPRPSTGVFMHIDSAHRYFRLPQLLLLTLVLAAAASGASGASAASALPPNARSSG